MNVYEDFPIILHEDKTINVECIPYYHAGFSQGITIGSLVTMVVLLFCCRRGT